MSGGEDDKAENPPPHLRSRLHQARVWRLGTFAIHALRTASLSGQATGNREGCSCLGAHVLNIPFAGKPSMQVRYAEADYWDQRYRTQSCEFDWFYGYVALRRMVRVGRAGTQGESPPTVSAAVLAALLPIL